MSPTAESEQEQLVYRRVLRARENLEAYLTLHGGREAEAVAPVTAAVDHLDAVLDELEFAPTHLIGLWSTDDQELTRAVVAIERKQVDEVRVVLRRPDGHEDYGCLYVSDNTANRIANELLNV